MRSKTKEFSHEPYRENTSSYSGDGVVTTVKRRRSKIGQHTTSEASNLMNSDSSHDSFTENAQSKSRSRTSDLSGASGNSSAMLSSGEILGGDNHSLRSKSLRNKNFSAIKLDDPRVLKGHDDNISSVSGAEQTNISSISVIRTEITNLPSSSASADGLVVESHEKVCDIQKSASCISDNVQKSEVGFDDEKLEIGARNDVGDLPDEALCEERRQEVEKVGDFPSLPEAKTTSFQSHHVDESDESDTVEHDVKVCDICGDAGREDLLAICCRCSDGAEHTYCMRERLDKVPEGDWLCEECNSAEEIDIQRQDKSGTEDRAEKDIPSEREDTEMATVCAKSDAKVSDVEGNRPNKGPSSAKGPGKRQADDIEVSTSAKRQALEPVITSPKAAQPSRLPSLSRDSSFKNLDGRKVKPTQQVSSGCFLKSNSFNFPNAKPKIKLVDEVPHTYRSSKETASHDTKEGALRGIGKSLSFKSVNREHLTTSESKVKMVYPKFSHVQDLKGSKYTNEKSFLERRNSFRSPRSSINPITSGSTISVPKDDQKFTSRGESASLSSTSNGKLKGVESNSRSTSRAKPLKHGLRSAAEGPASTGEDELSMERESTYLSERTTESSVSHPRLSIDAGANSVPCQKCKEVGHSSQFCTVDSLRSLGYDSSAPRTSREEIHEGNNLKAAIKAAMLKKPSIYRKNRNPSQSDEISISSMNSGSAPHDQLSSSNSMRSMYSVEGIEGKSMRNSDANLSKLSNGIYTKQLTEIPGEAVSASSGDGSSMASSNGKHLIMELPSHVSAAMSLLLQMSAIPDHEYIWQGSFEVHRGQKNPELWDGYQAHLSTCASPKVIGAVNKFPRHVLLNEVPRLSAWPAQFLESGVREDNIALYFFARDYESYERSYKILLERMMRSDLALRGNIDGVELLIFPSNQLPEKFQRWNMLYFFWGIFRGKKESRFQQGPVSPKKFCVPPDIPDGIVALPENLCSLGSTETILHMPDRSNFVVATAPDLLELPSFSSVETKNMEQQDCKPYRNSSTSAQIRLDESSPMMLVDINCDANMDKELQVSLEAPSAACGSNNTPMSEKVPDVSNSSNKVATDANTSQTKLWDGVKNNSLADGASGNKKQKTGPFEWNNPTLAKDDDFASRMGDGASENNNAERFLFPVDPPPPTPPPGGQVKGDDNLIPWRGLLHGKRGTPPSVELALGGGGEVKTSSSSRVCKIDINLDAEEAPEEEEEEALEPKTSSSRVGMLDINLDEPPPPEDEEEERALEEAEPKTSTRIGGVLLDINLDQEPPKEEEGEAMVANKHEWTFFEANRRR